jgi:hypothetical protein
MTGEPLADVQGEADAASSAGARFDAAALVEAALG